MKKDFWIVMVDDGGRQLASSDPWTDKDGFTKVFDSEDAAWAALKEEGLEEEGEPIHIKLRS